MIDSILFGLGFGLFFIFEPIYGFVLTYTLIFYIYNRFIYKNAIYSDGFLAYYFLGYAIVFILFECFIALHVPFDFPYRKEDIGFDYPVEAEYAEYNMIVAFFIPTYLIGSIIAFCIVELIDMRKIGKTPRPLHKGKVIIFGVLALSGLPFSLLVSYIVNPIIHPIMRKILKFCGMLYSYL